MHAAIVLLCAGLYGLPDAPPPPDDAQRARIERALAEVRRAEGEDADRWARELALVGAPALDAVVARLNEAEAPERLLLLAALRRVPEAAPLLAQARQDPHPAVRAFFRAPPRDPRERDLRALATRYLDLLALAEEKRREEAARDLAGLEPRLGRPLETFERMRPRLRDRRLADGIQADREDAARAFARVGGAALAAGALAPDLGDPVFAAYLALLREEGAAFADAVTALVRAGEAAAPALETCLARPQHDPRKIVRLLAAVRSDRGRGLLDRFDEFPADTQRVLVRLARRILPAEERAAFLRRAAVHEAEPVRTAALDALLEMDAPAGAEVARKLLDLERYGEREFARAAQLLARAGDTEPLAEWATIEVPRDESRMAERLRQVRRACGSALRDTDAPEVEELGKRLMDGESPRLRMLGADLVRSLDALAAALAREPDDALFEHLAKRMLTEHGAAAAPAVRDALAARGLVPSRSLVRAFRQAGALALLSGWAAADDETLAHRAAGQLALCDAVPPSPELAERFAGAEDGEFRRDLLLALLATGDPEVRARLPEDPDAALDLLAVRAERGQSIAFPYPLLGLVADADEVRLRKLGVTALSLPSLEPGLFVALIDRWDALAGAAPEDGEERALAFEEGPAEQRLRLVRALVRAPDPASAETLFTRFLAGGVKDFLMIPGICQAAARHLPPARLRALAAKMPAWVAAEYADDGKEAPAFDARRRLSLWGAMNACAHRQVPEMLPRLCAIVLDPELQPAAFDWRLTHPLPYGALAALRDYAPDAVAAAFGAEVAAAEADGRLARLEPSHLWRILRSCRGGRARGRSLNGVALALCGVLERLPWEGGDVLYERMLAHGRKKEYAAAAAAGRALAAWKRARGVDDADTFYSPDHLEGRAGLYAALATGDPKAFDALDEAMAGRPLLQYLGAWYTCFNVPDLAGAARRAEEAVRLTARLYHPYRDLLAGVRLKQGRPRNAIALLDLHLRLPVNRNVHTGWDRFFLAQAYDALGDPREARLHLEEALRTNRRLIPFAHAVPGWTERYAAVFRDVDDEFFDSLFE